MKRRDWIGILSKLLFWILSAIVIYWIILKLTNHSPTYDQVMITLVGILAAAHFTLSNKVSKHIGKMDQQMKESNRRFFALAKDFKTLVREFREHREDMRVFRQQFQHN